MSLDTFRSGLPEDEDLREVLTDPDSKEFSDLRDRMAYVYITGAFPTHLRSYFTNLLRAGVGPGDPLTVYVNGAVREGWR